MDEVVKYLFKCKGEVVENFRKYLNKHTGKILKSELYKQLGIEIGSDSNLVEDKTNCQYSKNNPRTMEKRKWAANIKIKITQINCFVFSMFKMPILTKRKRVTI